jgi:large subunit ribosomal protein L3
MGREKVTVQNLKIVRVDAEKGVVLVRGALPGPRNCDVLVRKAIKK